MKIAVIDDMSTDIEWTTKHIRTYFSEQCINLEFTIDSFPSGEEFLKSFKSHTYELIFIDYYMEDLCGLDVAFAIRNLDRNVKIIFTTASKDYAIDSYKVQASGYLVKPISYEDFAEILSLIDFKKLKEHCFIEITSGYHVVKIPLCDIIYCDMKGHYVQIHTANFGIQRSRMTFVKLKNLLKPYSDFLLCYRGCIINMNHIEYIKDFIFFLSNGERIPLCKKQHNEILKNYSEFLFDKVRKHI